MSSVFELTGVCHSAQSPVLLAGFLPTAIVGVIRFIHIFSPIFFIAHGSRARHRLGRRNRFQGREQYERNITGNSHTECRDVFPRRGLWRCDGVSVGPARRRRIVFAGRADGSRADARSAPSSIRRW